MADELELTPFAPAEIEPAAAGDLGRLQAVTVELSVEVGRTRMTLGPALALGVATLAAPFLLMQPGMGAGIAASRTPRPGSARLHSLITHAVFGLGLYASAVAVSQLGR
jgi:hypothetical protein